MAIGTASYYARTLNGRKTSSGERYNENLLTAAHRKYAFGTKLEVTNIRNHKKVVVKVNDRGPFVGGRIIDLSRAAANKIGMLQTGTAKVSIRKL
jgi:rare lipoprotein A